MIVIPCPHCGPRAQIEFTYGGDATVVRPDAATASTQEWLDHVYLRANARGPHLEWWQHTGGCRAWIKVRRDTATHQVMGAWEAGEDVTS